MNRIRTCWSGVLAAVLLLSCTAQAADLIALGVPAGVRMTAEGVVISGMSELDTPAGAVSPGQAAGLEIGDILQEADGVVIDSSETLADIVRNSGGYPIQLAGLRGDTKISAAVQPVQTTSDGAYQIGLLIRDSMAGIGTLTYVDPKNGAFGALGHPVTDVDSGARLPLETGSIIPAQVIRVEMGTAGKPGELIGTYDFSTQLGQLDDNTACGIFGTLTNRSLYAGQPVLSTAEAEEVHTGEAEILTCVSGSQPKRYAIVIEKIAPHASDSRNLSLRVTDQALLEQTGGIVPGMSGSPILQDGKIVGAVTHVLVNHPNRGYGILIGNMLEAAG